MPGSTIIKGHARQELHRDLAVSVTGSGGSVFGVFDASKYSRIAGVCSIIASGTIRVQFGIDSANPTLVSSTLVVNSGGSVFDFINYGHHIQLGFSQLASQTGARIMFYGEPIR